jgi:hypothetical protein
MNKLLFVLELCQIFKIIDWLGWNLWELRWYRRYRGGRWAQWEMKDYGNPLKMWWPSPCIHDPPPFGYFAVTSTEPLKTEDYKIKRQGP